MKTREAVIRVVEWINQVDSQSLQTDGSQASLSRADAGIGLASQLSWMKKTLLTAPTEEVQRDLLDHWTGTGALPRDLLGLSWE